jgi:hypothetical protein
MGIDLTKIAAASFMPGLQNSGQISGTASISGTLNPSGTDGTTSNMTGTFVLVLPDPNVISLLRVNLPDGHGQLASRWFPVIGTVELTDTTTSSHYRLVMFVQSHPLGRAINYNFVSTTTSDTITFSSFRIAIYGHLFSYPFS